MKIWLFSLCVVYSTIFAGGSDQEPGKEKYEYEQDLSTDRQRAVLFFIDSTEKEFLGAISDAFFSAIEQEAAPMVVSSSLLNEFFKRCIMTDSIPQDVSEMKNPYIRFAQQLQNSMQPYASELLNEQTIQKIINDIQAENKSQNRNFLPDSSNFREAMVDAVVHNRTFDASKWEFFNISNSYFLLIPHKYIKKYQYDFQSNIDELSGRLGFKLLEMQHIEPSNLTNFLENIPAENAGNLSLLLPKIFIGNKTYFNAKKQAMMPVWSIYLTGHGMPGRVAQMEIPDFKSLLNFFQYDITTKFFAYDACYAAGENAEKIYDDWRKASSVKTEYSYPIITAALTDASTSAIKPSLLPPGNIQIDTIRKKIITKFYLNYEEFVQRALSLETPIDFAYVIEPVMPLLKAEKLNGDKTAAQIRLPGLAWFSVIDLQNRAISIGSILAAAQNGRKLNVKKFYKQQTELPFEKRKQRLAAKETVSIKHTSSQFPISQDLAAILLYTTEVPFELDLRDFSILPHFISMVPGQAIHHISNIHAPHSAFSQIIKSFENTSAFPKVFIVDHITSSEPGLKMEHACSKNHVFTVENVIIRNGECYFEYDKLPWLAEGAEYTGASALKGQFISLWKEELALYRFGVLHKRKASPRCGLLSISRQDLNETVVKLQRLQSQHAFEMEKRAKKIATQLTAQEVYKDLAQLFFQLNSLNFALS